MVADLSRRDAANGAAAPTQQAEAAAYALAEPGGGSIQDPLAGARRIVIKVGSALLVDPEAGLREAWLDGLAEDAAGLLSEGIELLLVSSGAIALGRRVLRLGPGALSLEAAQAAASVGQIELSRAYAAAFQRRGRATGQVLLTLDDTQDRQRYLNGVATLKTLLSFGATPIVNENDTVATDEIRYGDNDRMAARVASMAGADRLILLSDVDGLYTGDPRRDPSAQRIARVLELTPAIEAMAAGAGSASGTGGMVTKLAAAKVAMRAGCAMAITEGRPAAPRDPNRPIEALRRGAAATWFLASDTPQAARKRWIAGMKPMGRLIIDAGAAEALERGRSLLAAGLRAVDGDFRAGDPVQIETVQGRGLGAALSSYAAAEARRIAGLKTEEIAAALGYPARAALAHRDDMALWEPATPAQGSGAELGASG
ncbi:MAG: glutamate 5-kinase [Pseudomonadota bacterium]